MGATRISVPRILKMAKTLDARTGASAFLPELGENLKIKKGRTYLSHPPSKGGESSHSLGERGLE
jgi:hypothetical protein